MEKRSTVVRNMTAAKTHSSKLATSLSNVAKSLSSRPIELRGPFHSSATIVVSAKKK